MKSIKAVLLMAIIALSLAGSVKAANSCCASADCCASCSGCGK